MGKLQRLKETARGSLPDSPYPKTDKTVTVTAKPYVAPKKFNKGPIIPASKSAPSVANPAAVPQRAPYATMNMSRKKK